MANQACISIGINQYQFFQSLGYGADDAIAIDEFFRDSAGWDTQQCLLLTDTSSSIGDKSTYPDRENITQWLNNWCWDTLHAGDLLWFFFSGYGVSTGDEDYLVPIDGNLDDIPNTCISLRKIYQQLSAAGVNALIFLDANRSQSVSVGGGIGQVAAKLAQEYHISTFLSCQSQELSHEAPRLGHGLFTAALLEALRYHPDLNLETLESYLASRLPELSEHHWRPLQTPVAIIPKNVSTYRPVFSSTTQASISSLTPELSPMPTTKPQLDRDTGYYEPPNVFVVSPESMGASAIVKQKEEHPRRNSIAKWVKGTVVALGVVAATVAGILALQPRPDTSLQGADTPTESVGSPTQGQGGGGSNVGGSGEVPSLAKARAFIVPGDATSHFKAVLAAEEIGKDRPEYAEAQQAIQEWANEIYSIAQKYASQQRWQDAIGTAQMVRPSASNYNAAQSSISEWQQRLQ
jgi:Caspase domain